MDNTTTSTSRPSTATGSAPEPSRPAHLSASQSQTLCRNILIHGYCKYADKGCIFNHDTTPKRVAQHTTPTPSSPERADRRFNVESPAFTPSSVSASKKGSLTPKAFEAAPFVPRPSDSISEKPSSADGNEFLSNEMAQLSTGNNSRGDLASAWQAVGQYPSFSDEATTASRTQSPMATTTSTTTASASGGGVTTPGFDYPSQVPFLSNTNQDMYFRQAQSYQPLQYHLYAPVAPMRGKIPQNQRQIYDFFLPNNIREELQRKSQASLQTLPQSSLPDSVMSYHSLVPLDTEMNKLPSSCGYLTWVYKAVSGGDGNIYALRRIEGFNLVDEKAIGLVQIWKQITHPNIVSITEAFTTHAFRDNSIVFVYDYFPLSTTLFEAYFGSNRHMTKAGGGLIQERVLMSYLVQMTSAIRCIHKAGLAARQVDLKSVILTSKGRIRLNKCGVLDVLYAGEAITVEELQQRDLRQLGIMILSLATNSLNIYDQTTQACLEAVMKTYSSTLYEILVYLVNPVGEKTIDSLVNSLSSAAFDSLDAAETSDDAYQGYLMRELENARLVRLLCKLGFINERPEYDHDPAWSESGDRYLIKLFRDYVFHSVDENGNPVVDMVHVLRCLNKLDAGLNERIMLVSRDEQTSLIVSYKELKLCIDSAFRDLSKQQQQHLTSNKTTISTSTTL